MARRTPLRTHLLEKYSPTRIVTACNRQAVPSRAGESFVTPDSGTRYEGTVPGSVGTGIVIMQESGFHFRNAPGGLCEACAERHAADF